MENMKREATEELLCKDDWDSWINGEPDGFFTLDIDSAGDITGTHTHEDETEHLVWGSCKHQGGRHDIELWELDQLSAYRYKGEIIPDAGGEHKTKDGKRKVFRLRRRTKVTADDEWTGVKTT